MERDVVNAAFRWCGQSLHHFPLPSLAEMEDVRLVAVCDLIAEKAERNAATFGIPAVYTDYREMLEKETCDAVYIVMPPQDSFDLLVDCLGRGLHTFSEKPPTVTTFQTRVLADLAERNGCITRLASSASTFHS